MIHSYFKQNSAPRFREWQTYRTWLLGVGLVLMVGPIFNLLSVFYHTGQNRAESVFWYALVPAIYGFTYPHFRALAPISAFHPYSDPSISVSWALIALALGVILWAKDRAADLQYIARKVPIKRTKTIFSKISLGFAIVLGIQLLRGGITVFLNAWAGAPLSWDVVIGWWITNSLGMLVALITAFLFTSVVTFWIPGAVLAIASLFLPFAIASILDKIVGYNASSPFFGVSISGPKISPALADPFAWLKALSPLKFTGTSSSIGGYPVQIGFDSGAHYLFMAGWVWAFWGIWIVTALVLTIRLFNQSPTE